MQKVPAGMLSKETADRCLGLVVSVAENYGIPPVHITAHITSIPATAARKIVWRTMVNEWGMRRHVVARMFGRDLRRLRSSVLDDPRPSRRQRVPWVLVGNQYFWDFNCWIGNTSDNEYQRKPYKIRHWVREIPDEIMSKIGGGERKLLRKEFWKQLQLL